MAKGIPTRSSAKDARLSIAIEADIGGKDQAAWHAFESESLRVYKELTIDPDIPWGVQTVETREKAEHALKQAIINSPVIDASVGERLQELSDWRFYLIGQQEKKKKRKKQAQDTAVVGFDNITVRRADDGSDRSQENTCKDRQTVNAYLEKLESFRISRRSQLNNFVTILDDMLEHTVSLFSIVRATNPASIPRVDVTEAEDLMASNDPPPVFVFTDVEAHRRRRVRTTSEFFEALKRHFHEVTVTDFASDARAEGSFSGHSLKVPEIEQRLMHRTSSNTISAYTSEKAFFIAPINLLDLQCLEPNVLPFPLTTSRYLLLDRLIQNIQRYTPGESRTSGKNTKILPGIEDFAGCRAFSLLGQTDAISMTHHDHHGVGTWVHVLEGLKLWIFWPQMSKEDWDDFKEEGMYWTGGRPQWILLRPGDILIMAPGRCIPHVVVTIETSTCLGGFFWDSRKMHSTLEAILQELQQDELKTTNEETATQLLPILEEFKRMSQDSQYEGRSDASSPEMQTCLDTNIDLLRRKQECEIGRGKGRRHKKVSRNRVGKVRRSNTEQNNRILPASSTSIVPPPKFNAGNYYNVLA